jgi:hypothetical protein
MIIQPSVPGHRGTFVPLITRSPAARDPIRPSLSHNFPYQSIGTALCTRKRISKWYLRGFNLISGSLFVIFSQLYLQRELRSSVVLPQFSHLNTTSCHAAIFNCAMEVPSDPREGFRMNIIRYCDWRAGDVDGERERGRGLRLRRPRSSQTQSGCAPFLR